MCRHQRTMSRCFWHALSWSSLATRSPLCASLSHYIFQWQFSMVWVCVPCVMLFLVWFYFTLLFICMLLPNSVRRICYDMNLQRDLVILHVSFLWVKQLLWHRLRMLTIEHIFFLLRQRKGAISQSNSNNKPSADLLELNCSRKIKLCQYTMTLIFFKVNHTHTHKLYDKLKCVCVYVQACVCTHMHKLVCSYVCMRMCACVCVSVRETDWQTLHNWCPVNPEGSYFLKHKSPNHQQKLGSQFCIQYSQQQTQPGPICMNSK